MAELHSDFNYKQPKKLVNSFTREYVVPKGNEKLSRDDFAKFSANPLGNTLRENTTHNAASVFAVRYRQNRLTDARLEQNIVEKVENIYQNKQWGFRERSKRVSEAKKRIAAQQYLVDEEKAITQAHNQRERLRNAYVSRYFMDRISENYTDQDERDAALNWMIGEHVTHKNQLENRSYFEKMAESPLKGRRAVLDSLPGLFKKIDFSYRNDNEFKERYGEKYYLLCRIVSAKAFLDHIENEKDLYDYRASKAAIVLAEEIKRHYEAKASLMKSHYYALTRESDVTELTGPDNQILRDRIRDNNYAEYLQRTLELRAEPLANGVRPDLQAKKATVGGLQDDNSINLINAGEIENNIISTSSKKKSSIINKDDEPEPDNIIHTGSEPEFEDIIDTTSEKKRKEAEEEKEAELSKDLAGGILKRKDLQYQFENNPLMKDMARRMNDLILFLGQKMPPIIREDDKAYDRISEEGINASCLMAATMYNNLQNSIKKCLDNPSSFLNNPEVNEQLQKTGRLIAEESSLFRHTVFEYRKMIASSEKTEPEDLQPSWLMALKYQRSKIIDIGRKGTYRSEIMSGATSTRYKLTPRVKGKKDVRKDAKKEISSESGSLKSQEVLFFTKNGRVSSEDHIAAIDQFLNDISEEVDKNDMDNIIKPVFDALKQDSVGNAAFDDQLDQLAGKDYRLVPYLMIRSANLKKTGNVLRSITIAGEKLTAGKYLSQYTKRVFQRRACTNIGIKIGSVVTERNVATSRMAQLFGVEDMICDSRTAVLKQNNSYTKGCLMEEAKGVTTGQARSEAKNELRKISYSDNAISQLFSMQIFDIICGQVDRHRDNFFVETDTNEEGTAVSITSVKGFDNDTSFGTLLFKRLEHGFNRIAPVNVENLKGVPIRLVNTIMHLDRHTIDHLFCDILSRAELDAIWNRLSGVRDKFSEISDLKYDEANGRYYYEGEDADDTVRQMKQLQVIKRRYMENQMINFNTPFHYEIVDIEDLQKRIEARKDKTGKNKNSNKI